MEQLREIQWMNLLVKEFSITENLTMEEIISLWHTKHSPLTHSHIIEKTRPAFVLEVTLWILVQE